MLKGLSVIASLSLLCLVHADSLRDQIDSGNAKIHGYMKASDSKGFKNFMKGEVTKDFKYVEGGRTETFDQMCAGMAMSFAQMKITKARSRVLHLDEHGNTGVSTTMHEMEGTFSGPDHKKHVMSFTGTSSDTYVKLGGKWKMSKMQWMQQYSLMDGKPMRR